MNTDSRIELPTQEALMPVPASDPMPRTVTYGCGGCDVRWPGISRAHCSGCHQTFNGVNLFDRHRRDVRGVGTCMDPATILNKAGEREMYLTGILWSSVENPPVRTAPRKQVSA